MKKISEKLSREEFQKIYNENNVQDAAKKLGCSVSCLFATLKHYKIPLKGRGGSKKRKLWIIG